MVTTDGRWLPFAFELNVYNYADILVEGAFRTTECRLAQMNVFWHYCLTFSANDWVFSLIEQQKVYFKPCINSTNYLRLVWEQFSANDT